MQQHWEFLWLFREAGNAQVRFQFQNKKLSYRLETGRQQCISL